MSVDSCAGLNIGNLRVHQWAATKYPGIVRSWIEFNDKDNFEPLSLNCAVADLNKEESNHCKLTAMVIIIHVTLQSTRCQCYSRLGWGKKFL